MKKPFFGLSFTISTRVGTTLLSFPRDAGRGVLLQISMYGNTLRPYLLDSKIRSKAAFFFITKYNQCVGMTHDRTDTRDSSPIERDESVHQVIGNSYLYRYASLRVRAANFSEWAEH